MMQPMPRGLALAALVLSLGTVAAFAILLNVFMWPLPPVVYLGVLLAAVALAAMAVAQRRRWLPIISLVVSVAVLGLGGFFHFVAARVPVTPTAFVIGRPAPEFTLPDSAGRTVSLADYRGRKPVLLVFYRGYW
jgi:hypothetical protein